MLAKIIIFVVGFFVGACVGIVLIALVSANRQPDEK